MKRKTGMTGVHKPRPITEVWLTPPEIIAAVGPFDLDPCAAPEPRPWPTATEHITLPQDGLEALRRAPKKKKVWFNPPYSTSEIRLWLPAMAEHGNGISLIFARTETDMFFDHVWDSADAVLFLRGRLHFHRPYCGCRADNNAGAPSALVAWGAENAARLQNCGIAGRFVQLKSLGVFG